MRNVLIGCLSLLLTTAAFALQLQDVPRRVGIEITVGSERLVRPTYLTDAGPGETYDIYIESYGYYNHNGNNALTIAEGHTEREFWDALVLAFIGVPEVPEMEAK